MTPYGASRHIADIKVTELYDEADDEEKTDEKKWNNVGMKITEVSTRRLLVCVAC